MKTDALIKHLSQFHPKGYDLSLGRIGKLLTKLDEPQTRLPPTFHVAGTNGKGSVVANLRSILETANLSVHTHTSPHLVNFHERYRIGHDKNAKSGRGEIISDEFLATALGRVADANDGARITLFELLAATMFLLFSEEPADYAIIEVGLGGRFDASNVITNPLASIITTISLDHQSYLGNTVGEIAFEKAGIIKPGCPVVIAPQTDEVREVLENIAAEKKCRLMIAGQDFDFYQEAGRFIYQDNDGLLDLPLPKLLGQHQLANSAVAIAATRMANCNIDGQHYEYAMENLYWPGRFERLKPGNITNSFKVDSEIWIDGGHNAGAGEAISHELRQLNNKLPKKLIMICAMLNSKDPQQYFAQFAELDPDVLTVPIISSEHGIEPEILAADAKKAGLEARSGQSLDEALSLAGQFDGENRLLIAGSLYLVGEVLKQNGTPPA